MTKHLTSTAINDIALSLDEDVYGANGDLSELEIRERLISNIHDATDYAYVRNGMIPIGAVASLIQAVWEYEDRKYTELMAETASARGLQP
jgi:hypothetical protein